MARNNGAVNYQLLKLFIDTIPYYDGDRNTLEIFIEHCEALYSNFSTVNPDDAFNSFLLRAIIGRLTGIALNLVGSRPEVRNWNDLKALLRLTFGDQRNLDCLVQDLMIMHPLKNEIYSNFGQRILKCRSAICSKLQSMNLPINEKMLKIKNYDELALKTFIRGLTGRVQDMVRLRNPDTIELAMSYVLEEENFMLNQRQTAQYKNLPQNPMQRPSFPPRPNFQNIPPNNFQNFSNQPRPNFPQNFAQAPNFSQQRNQFVPPQFNTPPQFAPQYNRPQFPSQPINIQSRPIPNQKYFTNREVFGSPNVFKPTGQVPRNQPTPMSTSTRNTQARRFQSHLQTIEPEESFSANVYQENLENDAVYSPYENTFPSNFLSQQEFNPSLYETEDANNSEDPHLNFPTETKHNEIT